ncbi:MAG: hypothetical protein HF312_02665 [Ignavibacteria bacterium]|jgi:hypothetical protein|nr:hypothetical protein [Ignavibacteria bacterium]MCU7519088.1 hypothetical protein [Ignavibacteria bacterium]
MEENKNKLKRIDEIPSSLDSLIGKLDKEKQDKIIEKHFQNNVDLERIKNEKVIKSRVAEHDLKIGQDNLEGLTATNRYYTHSQTVETGSGKIEIKVRGGDTKFIIPIVTVIGIIVIIILAIIFL